MSDYPKMRESLLSLGPAFSRELVLAAQSREGRRRYERKRLPLIGGRTGRIHYDENFWHVAPRLAQELLADYFSD